MSTSTVQGRATTGGPGGPRRGTGARVVRGLGAAALLVALVAGIPIGLWVLGGPVWTGPISLDQVIMTLTSPDVTGSVLIGLVKVVGWIAWLTFAIAVVIEVVAALRGRRSPHVRGLGAQQRAAAVLVGAVITMLVVAPSATPALAATMPTDVAETGTATAAPVTSDASAATGPAAGAGEQAGDRAAVDEPAAETYTVQPGDSLWRISEQTLGDGAHFKRIADLNYGVRQADGGALDAGNWIEPGWVLQLPAGASAEGPDGPSGTVDVRRSGGDAAGPTSAESAEVTVESGDTLWGIAEEELGDGTKYPEVFEASRTTEQPGGERLTDPDLILPGWTVTVPGAGEPTSDGANGRGEGPSERTPEAGESSGQGADEDGGAETDAEQDDAGQADAEQDSSEQAETAEPGSGSTAEPGDASGEASGKTAPVDEDAASATGAAGPRVGQKAPERDTSAQEAAEREAAAQDKADGSERTTPSTEVSPEGTVEVEPEDIEGRGSGNDVVDQPAGDQPVGERPAGEAPTAPEPNRVGAKGSPPKEPATDADRSKQDDSTGTAGPADAGTGSAGIGRSDSKDQAPKGDAKDPAPEETAEGNLVPQAPRIPVEPEGPRFDEVTPEDLQDDLGDQGGSGPQDSAPQGGSGTPGDAPSGLGDGEGLIADELMPQDESGESGESQAKETRSGAGTTWGDSSESADSSVSTDSFGTDVPGTGSFGTDPGVDEVLPDELAGDEPAPPADVPEVAIEAAAPIESSPTEAEPVSATRADAVDEPDAAVAEQTREEAVPQAGAGVMTAVATVPASSEPLLAATTDAVSGVVSDLAEELDESAAVRTSVGVGGLLAAGLIALIAVKRRRARKGRAPGETVVVPGPETAAGALERDLRAVEDPFGRSQVDQALRSLALWHRERGLSLPGVRVARLKSGEFVELYLDRAADLPAPWSGTADRYVWQLAAADGVAASHVESADHGTAADHGEAVEAPYPALVTVGHDDEHTHLMLDLESLACLDIRGTDAAAQATLAALAVELATSLWADDLQVTVVGALADLPGVVDTGRVRHVPNLAGVLRELEARAADVDRTLVQVGAASVADARGRGLATDAWTPEILLIGERLSTGERAQLADLVERVPGVGIAAVTSSAEVGDWSLDLTGELTSGDTSRGVLMPGLVAVRPQQLDAATYAQALALLAEPETAPGPTWSRSIDRTEPTLEEIPMDAVRAGAAESDGAVLGGPDETVSPWAKAAVSVVTPPGGTPVAPEAERDGPADRVEVAPRVEPVEISRPLVRVLGSVELADTTGIELPSTHQRQATELIAFLAFHPGSRGSDISSALWPSREPNLATRRSAVSRARRWLGTDASGHEYLPRYWSTDDGSQADLESAGYRLRGVRTDWHTFCDLVGQDLTVTSIDDLLAALDLVRGRPFEGVPLRKYAWAEQLMHTIASGVVDVSHEVARRALLNGDFAMARHASQVGRLADPVDERSWRNGIRAEIASGRRDAVGRLVDRLRDHLEQLAMEPEPDTEELLAQVEAQERRRESTGR